MGRRSVTQLVRHELVALRVGRGISAARISQAAKTIQTLRCVEVADQRRQLGRPSTAYELVKCVVGDVIPGEDRRQILNITLNVDRAYDDDLTKRRAYGALKLHLGSKTFLRREEEAYQELAHLLVVLEDDPCLEGQKKAVEGLKLELPVDQADLIEYLQPIIAAAITDYLKRAEELIEARVAPRIRSRSLMNSFSRFVDSSLPNYSQRLQRISGLGMPPKRLAPLLREAYSLAVPETPEVSFEGVPLLNQRHFMEHVGAVEYQLAKRSRGRGIGDSVREPEVGDSIYWRQPDYLELEAEYGRGALISNTIEYLAMLVAGVEKADLWP